MYRPASRRPSRFAGRFTERLETRTLLTAGDFDPSFSGDGNLLSGNAIYARTAGDVAVQDDGKVLVTGQRRLNGDYTIQRSTDLTVSRFNANGSPDTTFGAGGTVIADLGGYENGNRVLALNDRRTVAGTTSTASDYSTTWALLRYHPDGSPDADFGTGGVTRVPAGLSGYLSDIALAPDGKLLAVGKPAASPFTVMRFTASGQPDPTFSGDGTLTLDFDPAATDYVDSVAVLPDGRVVLAGYSARESPNRFTSDIILARLTPSGDLDPTFDGDGKAPLNLSPSESPAGLALDAAGRPVVVANTDAGPVVLRLTTSGAPDTTFANGDGVYTLETTAYGSPHFTSVGVAPNGDVVAAGWANPPGGTERDFFVTRLNDQGNRRTQFADDFHAGDDEAFGVAFAPDG
jgi:uncharacterized delta-60 repeat protein